MSMRARHLNGLVAALWLLVWVSALAVVTVRHENRLAFIAWRETEAAKVELQAERGRLLLEKATWAGRRNIVDDARQLGMAAPSPDKIITLEIAVADAVDNAVDNAAAADGFADNVNRKQSLAKE